MAIEDAYLLNRHLNKGISLDDFTMLQDLKMYGDKSFVVKEPKFLRKIILLDDETVLYDSVMLLSRFFEGLESTFNYIFNTSVYTGKDLIDICEFEDLPVVLAKFLILYDIKNERKEGFKYDRNKIKYRQIENNGVGSVIYPEFSLINTLVKNDSLKSKKEFYEFYIRFFNMPTNLQYLYMINMLYNYMDSSFKNALDFTVSNGYKYEKIFYISNNEPLNVNVRGDMTYDIGKNYIHKITKNTISILTNQNEIIAIYPYFKQNPDKVVDFLKNGGLFAYLSSFYNYYKNNGYDTEDDIYVDQNVISEIMKIKPVKLTYNKNIEQLGLINMLKKYESIYKYFGNPITIFYLNMMIFKQPDILIQLLENYNTFESLLYIYENPYIFTKSFLNESTINRFENLTKEKIRTIREGFKDTYINGTSVKKDTFPIYSRIIGNKKIQENLKKSLQFAKKYNNLSRGNTYSINVSSNDQYNYNMYFPFIVNYYMFKDNSLVDYFFDNISKFEDMHVDSIFYAILGTKYGILKYMNLTLENKKIVNKVLNSIMGNMNYLRLFFNENQSVEGLQIIFRDDDSNTNYIHSDTTVGSVYGLTDDNCLIIFKHRTWNPIFVTRDYVVPNIKYSERYNNPTTAIIVRRSQ